MSQEAIYNLSLVNPTVKACITNYHYNKEVSYTDALETMVVCLVEQNDNLLAQLIDCMSESKLAVLNEH